MCEVAEYFHPHLALHDVRFPVFQRQPVRRRAYGGRPDDVPLHLDALGRGARGHRPRRRGAAVKTERRDPTWVEVPQFPGGPVHLFGLEVGPLIGELVAVAKQPLGLLVFHLWLHLERLPVLVSQGVLRLLDFLVQFFAQFSAQVSVRQAPLTSSFWTVTLLLRLAAALAAGTGLWRAAVGLVAVSERRSDGRVQVIHF